VVADRRRLDDRAHGGVATPAISIAAATIAPPTSAAKNGEVTIFRMSRAPV